MPFLVNRLLSDVAYVEINWKYHFRSAPRNVIDRSLYNSLLL